MFVDLSKEIEEHVDAIQDLNKVVCFSDKPKVQQKAISLKKKHKKELKLTLKKLRLLS